MSESGLSDDVILVRAEGVIEAEVDGEQILLSPKDMSYFGLRNTGGPVWELIDGERTVSDVVASLQERYEGDADEIREQTLEFLDALVASGLVETRG